MKHIHHETLQHKRERRIYAGVVIAIAALVGIEFSLVSDEIYAIHNLVF